MNSTSKRSLDYFLGAFSFGFKSLILALDLSTILKLSFNDGSWVNYAVASVVLIVVFFSSRFGFKFVKQKSLENHSGSAIGKPGSERNGTNVTRFELHIPSP
jgi:hypothetical protein